MSRSNLSKLSCFSCHFISKYVRANTPGLFRFVIQWFDYCRILVSVQKPALNTTNLNCRLNYIDASQCDFSVDHQFLSFRSSTRGVFANLSMLDKLSCEAKNFDQRLSEQQANYPEIRLNSRFCYASPISCIPTLC